MDVNSTAVLKVETDIITSITVSPTGWAVIIYVEIFKTGIIVFIGDVKMCSTPHWPIIFNIRVSSCACELRTDLIFLWIKVSSVIQTLSVAHIKGKMFNLLITYEWWTRQSIFFLFCKNYLNSDGQQIHLYELKEQVPLTSNHWSQKRP